MKTYRQKEGYKQTNKEYIKDYRKKQCEMSKQLENELKLPPTIEMRVMIRKIIL